MHEQLLRNANREKAKEIWVQGVQENQQAMRKNLLNSLTGEGKKLTKEESLLQNREKAKRQWAMGAKEQDSSRDDYDYLHSQIINLNKEITRPGGPSTIKRSTGNKEKETAKGNFLTNQLKQLHKAIKGSPAEPKQQETPPPAANPFNTQLKHVDKPPDQSNESSTENSKTDNFLTNQKKQLNKAQEKTKAGTKQNDSGNGNYLDNQLKQLNKVQEQNTENKENNKEPAGFLAGQLNHLKKVTK